MTLRPEAEIKGEARAIIVQLESIGGKNPTATNKLKERLLVLAWVLGHDKPPTLVFTENQLEVWGALW